MRELKCNDFNSSPTTSNRYSYSYSTYLSYNNIHHYHQQVQFKRLSLSQNRQSKFHHSNRYSQENRENSTHNSTNKVT